MLFKALSQHAVQVPFYVCVFILHKDKNILDKLCYIFDIYPFVHGATITAEFMQLPSSNEMVEVDFWTFKAPQNS